MQVLDVEANRVDNLETIEFLALCPHLHTLTLTGNQACAAPFFRRRVASAIPQLQVGLRTAVEPLLSRSATGEFNSPQIFADAS